MQQKQKCVNIRDVSLGDWVVFILMGFPHTIWTVELIFWCFHIFFCTAVEYWLLGTWRRNPVCCVRLDSWFFYVLLSSLPSGKRNDEMWWIEVKFDDIQCRTFLWLDLILVYGFYSLLSFEEEERWNVNRSEVRQYANNCERVKLLGFRRSRLIFHHTCFPELYFGNLCEEWVK